MHHDRRADDGVVSGAGGAFILYLFICLLCYATLHVHLSNYDDIF